MMLIYLLSLTILGALFWESTGQIIGSRFTHVFFSTNNEEVLPILVLLNSTISNTNEPDLIRFHMFAPEIVAKKISIAVSKYLPEIANAFETDSTSLFDLDISKRINLDDKMYTSRPNLMNIYNFAAFYIPLIPRYKYIEKLIYLDTDVVVLGDIRSIDNRCCDNKPAAAVEDCSQRFEAYIEYPILKRIFTNTTLSTTLNNHDKLKIMNDKKRFLQSKFTDNCVFNRGLVMIDMKIWNNYNITGDIERWMTLYNKFPGLWWAGVSQQLILLQFLIMMVLFYVFPN